MIPERRHQKVEPYDHPVLLAETEAEGPTQAKHRSITKTLEKLRDLE
jgi:hypothetical protein